MSRPVMAPRKRPEAVLEMRLDSAAVGSGNGMVTTLVIKHKALKEGEHVLARCDGNLFAWNAAKITKDNGDGTYDLKYTSGGCLGLRRETQKERENCMYTHACTSDDQNNESDELSHQRLGGSVY